MQRKQEKGEHSTTGRINCCLRGALFESCGVCDISCDRALQRFNFVLSTK